MYRNELFNIMFQPDEDMLLYWKCNKVNFLAAETDVVKHLKSNLRMKRQHYLSLFSSFNADRGDEPAKNVTVTLRLEKLTLSDSWSRIPGMVLGDASSSIHKHSRLRQLIGSMDTCDGYSVEVKVRAQDSSEMHRLLEKLQRVRTGEAH